jgi:hypothetical protein
MREADDLNIIYFMKVIAFGDSFVKMFIHCQPAVKQWKFKGKSIKGLVKEDDRERSKIEKEVRKSPNGTTIVMVFGQVDFNYVRYYKVIHGEPPLSEETFRKYIEWVASMNVRNNISVFSIFPTPMKREYIVSSLINKASYFPEEQTSELDSRILKEYDNTRQTWERWNSWIQCYCEKYKVNNVRLFEKHHLEPEFYDLSNLTVHLRYVPVLKLAMKHIGIEFDSAKAEEVERQYEKEKMDRISSSTIKIYNVKCEQSKCL